MKRYLIVILCMLLLVQSVSLAVADRPYSVPYIDWQRMTDEQLEEIIESAQAEQARRAQATGDAVAEKLRGQVICACDGLMITVTDVYTRLERGDSETKLIMEVLVQNDSSSLKYEGFVDVATVNGWKVDELSHFTVPHDSKAKDTIQLFVGSVGVNEIGDVHAISLYFTVLWTNQRGGIMYTNRTFEMDFD